MTAINSNSNNNSEYKAKHEFIAVTNAVSNNNNNNGNFSSKYVVIAIGKSGAGKSSLIGLFNQQCRGSKTAKAGTSKSTIHRDSTTNTRRWMDTVGVGMADDADEKTLKDIMQLAYNKHINQIKIVWIVNGDLTRELNEFQQQAKFINSFSSKTSSVWDSCLIIQKEGRFKPKLKSIIGIAQTAGSRINYNDKNDQHTLGYTYLDQISADQYEDYSMLEELYDDNDTPDPKKMKKYGFLTDKQIRAEIDRRLSLSALPILKLNFISERCNFCAVTGDHRYLYEKCHVRQEIYHPGKQEQFHSGTYIDNKVERMVGGAIVVAVAAGGTAAAVASAGLAVPVVAGAVGGIAGSVAGNMSSSEEWSCCHGSMNASGCKTRYACCLKDNRGCQIRCAVCEVEWGCAPGCTFPLKM